MHNPVCRWKKIILPEDLYLCETLAGDLLQEFGYKLSGLEHNDKSIKEKALAKINKSELLKNAMSILEAKKCGVEMYPIDPCKKID